MATLVTGFPRFVAKVLIERLKELRPEEPVHLVVLPQKLAAARKHLGRPKGFTIHRGDVASTDLGLGADSLSELLPTVRQIIHFAQIHHPSAGRKIGYQVNVHGTQNTLRFAQDCAAAQGGAAPRIVHLSSLFVLGAGSGRVNAEACAAPAAPQLVGGCRAPSRGARVAPGLPYTVLRPGLIIGHSKTGKIDKLGGLYELGVMAGQLPRNVPPSPELEGDDARNRRRHPRRRSDQTQQSGGCERAHHRPGPPQPNLGGRVYGGDCARERP